MPGRDAILRGGTAALAAAAFALVGCGGGEQQDAGERDATYTVSVLSADFPRRQQLAEETEMRITVRNDSDRAIPNLAATIEAGGDGTQADAFGTLSDEPGVSARSRPVWIVDDGPLSGDTAYANTWTLGSVGANQTRTFTWRVSAIKSGDYDVTYRLSGSLSGKARLVDRRTDKAPAGRFAVVVNQKPRQARIDARGEIVTEPAEPKQPAG